jgi:hypothetical protein
MLPLVYFNAEAIVLLPNSVGKAYERQLFHHDYLVWKEPFRKVEKNAVTYILYEVDCICSHDKVTKRGMSS